MIGGNMSCGERVKLLERLANCGYMKTMANGEEREVRPPVYFGDGYYSFDKGYKNFNHWLVDEHGFSLADDEDKERIDFRIRQLAELWGVSDDQ